MKAVDNLILLGGLFAAGVGQAQAATFTVDTLADGFTPNTLRGAIQAINNTGCVSPNTIAFSVAGDMQVSFGALPAINCAGTLIDGYTAPGASPNTAADGSNAVITVGLNSQANSGSIGLQLNASDIVVQGMSLTGWSAAAIAVKATCTLCAVQGNFINFTKTGSPTSGAGVVVENGSARVGGSTVDQRNLIASVTGFGVQLAAPATVAKNAFNTTPGGAAIPGSTVASVFVNTSGGIVQNNIFRGLGVSVLFNSANTLASGTSITGNTFKDVQQAAQLYGFSQTFMNNTVSFASDSGVVVGGSNQTIDSNLIENASTFGISFTGGADATITGNTIRNNAFWGIDSPGPGSVVDGNTITGNGNGGVRLMGGGVTMSFNAIYGNNGQPAVDNFGNGPDLNDDVTAPYDTDPNPLLDTTNRFQNHPKVLLAWHSGGNTHVKWQLRTEPISFPAPPGTFVTAFVDFFSNFGIPSVPEGQTPIHSTTITPAMTVDAVGAEYGQVTVIAGLHDNISATAAVDKCGDNCWASSEYSPAVAVTPTPSFLLTAATSTVVGANTPIAIMVDRGTSTATYDGLAATLTLPAGATVAGPLASASPPACGTPTTSVTPGSSSISATGGTTLATSATCVLVQANIVFSAPGTHTITLPVNAASGTTPFAFSNTAAITATIVVNAPAVQLTPASVTFAGQPVGTMSLPQTVTLRNSGTADLLLSSIVTTGDFATAGCTMTSLAPGASCPLTITFTPTALGSRTGRIDVNTNAAGSPHVVALTGTGTTAPAPSASFTATSLAFGPTMVGSASAPQTITLKNLGSANLVISNIVGTGDFRYSGCGFPLTLAPGASCDFVVRFMPLSAGNLTGAIDVTTNASGSPHRIGLSGEGVSALTPIILLTSNNLPFGAITVGTSALQRVRVTNVGSAALVIDGIDVSGSGFSQSNNCPGTLPIRESCTIEAVFTPPNPGTHSGAVAIRSNATPSPQVITLSGEGVALPPAVLGVSRASIDFGQHVVGTTARQPLQLTNSGGQPLTVAQLRIPAPFSIEGACSVIAPGGTCDLTLLFTPTAIRAFSGSLEVVSNNNAGNLVVELAGAGVRAPAAEIVLSDAGIGFGNQGVGTESSPQTITVRSVGGLPVQLRGVTLANPEFVVDARACPAVLASGASCDLSVVFRPFAAGPRIGRLIVQSEMAGEPPTVSLTGTGCRPFAMGGGRNTGRLCSP